MHRTSRRCRERRHDQSLPTLSAGLGLPVLSCDSGDTGRQEKLLDQLLEEVNAMVGLAEVKKYFNDAAKVAKVKRKKERLNLMVAFLGGHLVFEGSPGTGKTTMARKFALLLHSLGVVRNPEVFREVSRADLVGGVMGETAMKTKKVVNSAKGGILFIDEAYALVKDSRDAFGQEAVDTLISEIENARADLTVILGGYPLEMQEFLSVNPGFKSRIVHTLRFNDYDVGELMQIMRQQLNPESDGRLLEVKGQAYSVVPPRGYSLDVRRR